MTTKTIIALVILVFCSSCYPKRIFLGYNIVFQAPERTKTKIRNELAAKYMNQHEVAVGLFDKVHSIPQCTVRSSNVSESYFIGICDMPEGLLIAAMYNVVDGPDLEKTFVEYKPNSTIHKDHELLLSRARELLGSLDISAKQSGPFRVDADQLFAHH